MPYDPTPVLHTLPGGGTATANVYVLPPSEAGPIDIAAGVAQEIDVPFFRGLPDWQWLIAQNLQIAAGGTTTVRLFATAPVRTLIASIDFDRVANSAIWRNAAGTQLATLILAPATGVGGGPTTINLFDTAEGFITSWDTGEMTVSGSWLTTLPYPAVEGDTFDFSGAGFTSASFSNGGAMFYDASDVFISGSQQGATNDYQTVTHTAPAGTAFVRFSGNNSSPDPRIVNVPGPVIPEVDEIDLAIAINQDNGQMQVFVRYDDDARNAEIGFRSRDKIIRPIAGGNFGPDTDFTVETFSALQTAASVSLEIESLFDVTTGEIIGVRLPIVAVGNSIVDDDLTNSIGPILAGAFSEPRFVFNTAIGGAGSLRIDGTRLQIPAMFGTGVDKMPGVVVLIGDTSRNDIRFFENGTDRNRLLFGRLIVNAVEFIATSVVMGNLGDSFDHDDYYGDVNDVIILDILRSTVVDDTSQEFQLTEEVSQGLSDLAYELHPYANWVDTSGYTGGFSTSHPTQPELLAEPIRLAYENNVRAPAPPVEGVDLPEPNEVIIGATTNGQPGTVILPPVSQVEEGEEYGPNGSLQGTLVIVGPTPVDARDLRAGVEQEFGDTGTLAVPTFDQVLQGVPVDDGVGTLMVGDGGTIMVPSDDAQVIVSAVIAGIEREDGKLVGVATELSKVERSENPVEAGGIVAKRLYESDGVTIATNADGSPAEILEQTV